MTKNSGNAVKWIVIIVGSLLFLGLFSYLIFLAKQSKNEPSGTAINLSNDGWIRGDASASATLVEFGDFQCPACKAYEQLVEQLMKDENGKVKLLYKYFPLTNIHQNAMAAAIAAEAAGRQNKFWEMHDMLYEKQDEWADLSALDAQSKFISYATNLKLNIDQFKKDLSDKAISDKISKMQQEGVDAGVAGTPTFFINGKLIQNPQSYQEFKTIIDNSIK